MTAEEMFKELGFIKNTSICYSDEHILYEKPVNNGTDIFTIEFKDGYFVYTNTFRFPIKTNMEVLKAINKQVEELGW